MSGTARPALERARLPPSAPLSRGVGDRGLGRFGPRSPIPLAGTRPCLLPDESACARGPAIPYHPWLSGSGGGRPEKEVTNRTPSAPPKAPMQVRHGSSAVSACPGHSTQNKTRDVCAAFAPTATAAFSRVGGRTRATDGGAPSSRRPQSRGRAWRGELVAFDRDDVCRRCRLRSFWAAAVARAPKGGRDRRTQRALGPFLALFLIF